MYKNLFKITVRFSYNIGIIINYSVFFAANKKTTTEEKTKLFSFQTVTILLHISHNHNSPQHKICWENSRIAIKLIERSYNFTIIAEKERALRLF